MSFISSHLPTAQQKIQSCIEPLRDAAEISLKSTAGYIALIAVSILYGMAVSFLTGGAFTTLSAAILTSKWIFPIVVGLGAIGIAATAVCSLALVIAIAANAVLSKLTPKTA